MNLAKMFLILSTASFLSKDKLEKKGSVNLSGIDKVTLVWFEKGW